MYTLFDTTWTQTPNLRGCIKLSELGIAVGQVGEA